MHTLDVIIRGFALNAPERPERGLTREFALSGDTARSIVQKFPCLVGLALPESEARELERRLLSIGARVLVQPTGEAQRTGVRSVLLRGPEPKSRELERAVLAAPAPVSAPIPAPRPGAVALGRVPVASALSPQAPAREAYNMAYAPTLMSLPKVENDLEPSFPSAGAASWSIPAPQAPSLSAQDAFSALLPQPALSTAPSKSSLRAPPSATLEVMREFEVVAPPLTTSDELPARGFARSSGRPTLARAPQRARPDGLWQELPRSRVVLRYLPVLGVSLVALAIVGTGGSLLVRLFFGIATLVLGSAWVVHLRATQKRALDTLEAVRADELPLHHAEAMRYEAWAAEVGFRFEGLRYAPSDDFFVLALFRNDELPAVLAVGFSASPLAKSVQWELMTPYTRGAWLVTTSAPNPYPPLGQPFLQAFSRLDLSGLLGQHEAAQRVLSDKRKLQPALHALTTDAVVVQRLRKEQAELSKLFAWPFLLPLWRLQRASQNEGLSVADQVLRAANST